MEFLLPQIRDVDSLEQLCELVRCFQSNEYPNAGGVPQIDIDCGIVDDHFAHDRCAKIIMERPVHAGRKEDDFVGAPKSASEGSDRGPMVFAHFGGQIPVESWNSTRKQDNKRPSENEPIEAEDLQTPRRQHD